jgi:hypothetical protein
MQIKTSSLNSLLSAEVRNKSYIVYEHCERYLKYIIFIPTNIHHYY